MKQCKCYALTRQRLRGDAQYKAAERERAALYVAMFYAIWFLEGRRHSTYDFAVRRPYVYDRRQAHLERSFRAGVVDVAAGAGLKRD